MIRLKLTKFYLKMEKGVTEVEKLMGIGRTRAVNAFIDLEATGENPYGLVEDDLRCDAEWVEIDENGMVVKSSANATPLMNEQGVSEQEKKE